ncbi:MAG: glycine cleavage system aminomethyltransferase GcvT [Bdellovibrionales bacterium]
MQRTPLFQNHLDLKAKMVEFAGWEMPIQYTGLKEEHLCVRNHVGLFDVSHMGEIRVRGPKAVESLQWLTTNNVAALENNQAQYSLLPNAEGGLVDDIIVYCLEKNQDYLVCVNAANEIKDWEHIQKNNRGAELTNESRHWGQIAIQGPKAQELIQRVTGIEVTKMKPFQLQITKWKNFNIIFATTGYTGEKGGEIFIEAAGTSALWMDLLEKGQNLGVSPIGLGARDTLRTEMKYSLYGHEINDVSNPYEAGLGWAVKPQVKDFLGKTPILNLKEKGLTRSLIGFRMLERGIPRQDYTLHDFEGKQIGYVTSGTHSPSLDAAIGIGYVHPDFSSIGSEFTVDIRGKRIRAQTCPTPFYGAKA